MTGHAVFNKMQEDFCLNYIKCMSGRRAAMEAGYKTSSAASMSYQLLQKPHIQERIAKLRQKAEDEAIAQVMERKIFLTKIIRAKLDEEDITVRDQISATDKLNQMDGGYPKDGQGDDNRVINFILSSEQGRGLMEGIAKRLSKTTETIEEIDGNGDQDS